MPSSSPRPNHWHVRRPQTLSPPAKILLESQSPTPWRKAPTLTARFAPAKQILQCACSSAVGATFATPSDLIQGGSLGRIPQVRTYWWTELISHTHRSRSSCRHAGLDWKQWQGGAPEQPFNAERFYLWRWFWNSGGGAMTDLFTHWIDVVHWAMNPISPRTRKSSR